MSSITSHDLAQRSIDVAVLPVGSFEQHGGHLPLTTDSLIAAAIAHRLADDYDLLALPPVMFGCSHEHAAFPGTVSIKATTLYTVMMDIVDSLRGSDIAKLVIVNGHGGNYVLNNVARESNVIGPRVLLFPQQPDWTDARHRAGLLTSNHEDMHGGEAETSIMLDRHPDLVGDGYRSADHLADDRRHLLTVGLASYAPDGIIGRPSLATAEKGRLLLDALSSLFKAHLAYLRPSVDPG